MAEQTLRPFNPSWRDKLGAYLYDMTSKSPEARNFVGGLVGSRGLGSTGMGLVDATPLGVPLQMQESYQAGDAKGMALAALPMPVKAGAGMVKRAAEEVAQKAPHIIAYHGSPHSFDRFDLSKIGTGEGAQAYGHGLYFAESEPVAKAYRDQLAPRGQQDAAAWVSGANGDKDKAVAAYLDAMGMGKPGDLEQHMQVFPWTADRTRAEIDAIRNYNPGSMYQVRINADPEHFLDWDKPLIDQSPVVQERLLQTGWSPEHMKSRVLDGGYVAPTTPFGSQKYAEAGIPGIKYLDQGSRGAGEGSRNYVVFDDKLVDILKKYGLAGLLAGGGGMGMMQPKDAQAVEMPGDRAHEFDQQQGIGVDPRPVIGPYPETWRDRVASTLAGDSQGGSYRRGVAERIMGSSGLGHTSYGAADLPIIGNVFGANDAYVNNDLNGVFLNALGLATLPVKMPKSAKTGVGLSLTGAKALNSLPLPTTVDEQRRQRP